MTDGIHDIRAAALSLFLVSGLRHGETLRKMAELARSSDALDCGADAVYRPMRPKALRLLENEGVRVVGHVGLVPRRSTWFFPAPAETASIAENEFAKFLRCLDRDLDDPQ